MGELKGPGLIHSGTGDSEWGPVSGGGEECHPPTKESSQGRLGGTCRGLVT